MEFAVESWAPEYGSALTDLAVGTEAELSPAAVAVRTDAEVAEAVWAPRDPRAEAASVVRFLDGVRRIDARVWITDDAGQVHQGLAASYAAGVVRCDGAARVESCAVRRTLFSAAPSLSEVVTRNGSYQPCPVREPGDEQLTLRLQQVMGDLERLLAVDSMRAGDLVTTRADGTRQDDELLVVDGPLSGVPLGAAGAAGGLPAAVGYVKSHRRSYLPPELTAVVAALRPGQRTPLFLTTTGWSRWSWYLRLPPGRAAADPSGTHSWAGVVRCEASGDLDTASAVALADRSSVTLPRYASTPQKDPRAPQNLVPVGQLERHLRHALGDARLLERALRVAAAA